MTDLTRLDRAGIEAILPHRAPFLFVERILAHEPGRSIVGMRRVARADPNVTTGPDGVQTLSSAILCESLLQVGALLVMAGPDGGGQFVIITGIEHLRYHDAVRVGEEVHLEAMVLRRIGSVGRMRGSARVGRRLVAHGTIRFALVPGAQQRR